MRVSPFLLLCLSITSFAQSASDSLTNDLSGMMADTPFQGMGVAVISTDNILYQKCFGYANVETKTPYTIESLQPIGSISKTFLGVSLVKAQESGILSLDDPVNKYLPFELKNPNSDEPILIRHLATHTSGIKDTKHYEKAYLFHEKIPETRHKVFDTYAKVYNENTELDLTHFLSSIYAEDGEWYSKKNFLRSNPGDKYEYSNNGAALAALILESASGQSYNQYVKTTIFEPLEMRNTGWNLADYDERDKSTLYAFGYPIPDFHLITYADGGVVTNIKEFSMYFRALMKSYYEQPNQLLSIAASKELFTQQFDPEFSSGIFLVVGQKRIGHTGGDPGVTTAAFFNIESGTGIVIFANTSGDNQAGKSLGDLFRLVDSYAIRLKK